MALSLHAEFNLSASQFPETAHTFFVDDVQGVSSQSDIVDCVIRWVDARA